MAILSVSRVLLVAFAATLYAICRPPFSASRLDASLTGQVALVTGGSRGIGKGIAVGLGEAGATVYITGRTASKGGSNNGGIHGTSQAGSLEETCQAVIRAGGQCVPVAADSADDRVLEEVFERIWKEQGRLDILVNNAFSAVSWLPSTMGQAFWEKGPDAWDKVNTVGLRSHYLASVFAARLMSKAKQGLIVNVGSFGGMNYIFDVSYGIGKAAMDRMANDMAIELATENVTMVSVWPGLVKTENVADGALKGMKERRGYAPGSGGLDMEQLLPSPLAETPLFTGRAIAAFARDPKKMDFTGKVIVPSVMAWGYGILDERGLRSPPFTSLKFLLSVALQPLLRKCGIWEVPGSIFSPEPVAISNLVNFYWNLLPDLSFPGLLLKMGTGAPNL
eukprot:TRINITY_DN16626_c0_g1_i1.p1 TRINITY_DN16626_c0_g1~~TRINITY_DN16626_c0_g1_i1.p1  ORF type:complete len:408 (+),score=74.37 TRINITY_DN16626_c0_g1_i1:47-1225(+)